MSEKIYFSSFSISNDAKSEILRRIENSGLTEPVIHLYDRAEISHILSEARNISSNERAVTGLKKEILENESQLIPSLEAGVCGQLECIAGEVQEIEGIQFMWVESFSKVFDGCTLDFLNGHLVIWDRDMEAHTLRSLAAKYYRTTK